MCGIVGFLSFSKMDCHERIKSILYKMAEPINSRGPDHFGIWSDHKKIALAHKRLAIIDLTHEGSQPMVSPSGRFVIIFNGEIYNHLLIRKRLEYENPFTKWRGRSDTETLISAIDYWGIEKTLSLVRGMFSFGLWDCDLQKIVLVRDRVGQKPMYYGRVGSSFIFGSQIKSLKKFPGFEDKIDQVSVQLMLNFGFIPSPRSIYQNIFKLPAGCMLEVKNDGSFDIPCKWFDLLDNSQKSAQKPFLCSDNEAIERCNDLLTSSVKEQLVADVPLGALFSGGIDSSLIVAIMQSQSIRPIKTFTIAFHEKEFNEGKYAKTISDFIGTDHKEIYFSPETALDLIPKLPEIYDEPFADSSQIPTALVCSEAKKYVKVALTGDAGDELFAGYNRHIWFEFLWKVIKNIPRKTKQRGSQILLKLSSGQYDQVFDLVQFALPQSRRINNLGNLTKKFANAVPANSQQEFYRKILSRWNSQPPYHPNLAGDDSKVNYDYQLTNKTSLNNILLQDMLMFLPDDILVKIDRASMASSLETRIPFLDERLIDFAFRISRNQKIRNGQGKWILRKVLEKYVPKAFFNRSKHGFSLPIDKWLRGPLRCWAEDLLSDQALSRDDSWDIPAIRTKWKNHLDGSNFGNELWTILMYQSWRKFQDS